MEVFFAKSRTHYFSILIQSRVHSSLIIDVLFLLESWGEPIVYQAGTMTKKLKKLCLIILMVFFTIYIALQFLNEPELTEPLPRKFHMKYTFLII